MSSELPVRLPERLKVNLKELKPHQHGGSTGWRVDLPTTTVGMHVEEIPVGGSTSIHRHEEALIHILQGKGRSEVQGRVVEWEEGDFLMIPANAWHRHWNTGDKPVRFVATYASKLLDSIGAHYVEDRGYKTYEELKKEGVA